MTHFSTNRLQTLPTIALTLFALTLTTTAFSQSRTRFEGATRSKAAPSTIKALKPTLTPRSSEPEDESTINLTLETGDEELDHTLGASDDTIGRSRAAVEISLGPRSGRTTTKSNPKLVSRALSYRGARYSFGASGTNGIFDCSSFVQHLMRSEGISLPRTARDQFSVGKRISRADLQPGDVVFFAGTYRSGISHVGMYVGNGLFVHAASSRRGVVVDPLDLPYYNAKFAGARRMK